MLPTQYLKGSPEVYDLFTCVCVTLLYSTIQRKLDSICSIVSFWYFLGCIQPKKYQNDTNDKCDIIGDILTVLETSMIASDDTNQNTQNKISIAVSKLIIKECVLDVLSYLWRLAFWVLSVRMYGFLFQSPTVPYSFDISRCSMQSILLITRWFCSKLPPKSVLCRLIIWSISYNVILRYMSNSHYNRLTPVSKLTILDQVESFPKCFLCTW